MKNIIKLKAMLHIAGIVALAAAIVFSMAACDDGSGGPDGGGGGGGGGAGTLNVTGLPQGSWSVFIYPAGTDISTFRALANNHSSAEAGGAANIAGAIAPVRLIGTDYYWRGSGNREVSLNSNTGSYYATVNFSNGNATVPFSIFKETVNDW